MSDWVTSGVGGVPKTGVATRGGPAPAPLPASALPKPLGTNQGVGTEMPYDWGNPTSMGENGSNPYTSVTNQDQQNLDAANSAFGALPGQLNSMFAGFQSKLDALYQSFQNESGLGSGIPYGQQQQAQPDPSASSHGFNPWSLRGEALSR